MNTLIMRSLANRAGAAGLFESQDAAGGLVARLFWAKLTQEGVRMALRAGLVLVSTRMALLTELGAVREGDGGIVKS